jgi:group II intron reverse transcriptase/maturase
MRNPNTIRSIHQKRGSEGLPLERIYRHLFDVELFLRAYGKIYRNAGATTPGSTEETVDGMSLRRIHTIIDLLRQEKYVWTPVRRTGIPKANGKKRPLGIPTWSDKLLQEALRTLLEPYYEQRFSNHSHGFRPDRGCHTALLEVSKTWKGTIWFIEGDIQGCFDNFAHEVLLSIIRRDIHDGRFVKLIEGLLQAGYMEDWKYYDTLSGTPQGGIISPLLANIYLNELDRFVEDTLIPTYTRGEKRKPDRRWKRLCDLIYRKRKSENPDSKGIKQLLRARRKLPAVDPYDPGYRRLRYIRYADDFLLGFVGPKKEAEAIRQRLGEFLEQQLHLTLSEEKTLITHAAEDKAKFLGYEITVSRNGSLLSANGKRATNGPIALLMPRKVVQKIRERYSKKGKITHRNDVINDTDYTILQRYQSVLRGIYNFYCMAVNVGNDTRMGTIKWILETSLTKTLARKFKCRMTRIYQKYQATFLEHKILRVIKERPGKQPLIAVFGGIPFERIPEGAGVTDLHLGRSWSLPANKRSEVVHRLLVGKCELCDAEDVPVEVHQIRKLADIDRPGRRPKASWQKLMIARRRKTLVVCEWCHNTIHTGEYDGPAL